MSNDRVSNAMSPGPSYPSPTAAQVGAGAAPFYGQNGGSPSQIPTDLQRLQQADLGQEAAMMLSTPTNDVQHYTENDIPMDASMTEPTSQERMAQGVLSLDHGDVGPSSAARKRSKVSRACDECRRKKVRRHFAPFTNTSLTSYRFDATRHLTTSRSLVLAVGVQMCHADSVASP